LRGAGGRGGGGRGVGGARVAWPAPASRKNPARALRMRLMEIEYGIGTTPGACRVPATSGVPVPGLYGVKSERHNALPALPGFVNTPFTEKAASRNFVPLGWRRGSPGGSVGSRKQTVNFAELKAASAPVVWST